jgi:hypothetical protein
MGHFYKMAEDESTVFLDKLWEGVDVLNERLKDAKKYGFIGYYIVYRTTDEVKSRINNVSSTEKDNADDLISLSQKFNKLTEIGQLQNVWISFGQNINSMGSNLKFTAERMLTLLPALITDIENYAENFDKLKDDLPSLRKKKDRAIEDVQKVMCNLLCVF